MKIIQKITNFIKYHNAFTVSLLLVFLFGGVVFASDTAQDIVIGEQVVTKTGVDNTKLLSTDFDNFDFQITVIGIQEDDKKYYIEYSFNTIGIKDNVWQKIANQPVLTVYKDTLGNNDLGIHITEKFSQVVDYQLSYLKEVQEAEIEKGKQQIVETTKYTGLYHGLIGKVLDVKEKVLPGYEPVVEPKVEKLQEKSKQVYDENTEDIFEDDDYIDDSAYFQKLEELCLENNLFWYKNDCHDNCQEIIFYADADGDGFGDLNNTMSSCELIDGFVENSDDCDDSDAEINIEAIEIPEDVIDDTTNSDDVVVVDAVDTNFDVDDGNNTDDAVDISDAIDNNAVDTNSDDAVVDGEDMVDNQDTVDDDVVVDDNIDDVVDESDDENFDSIVDNLSDNNSDIVDDIVNIIELPE